VGHRPGREKIAQDQLWLPFRGGKIKGEVRNHENRERQGCHPVGKRQWGRKRKKKEKAQFLTRKERVQRKKRVGGDLGGTHACLNRIAKKIVERDGDAKGGLARLWNLH